MKQIFLESGLSILEEGQNNNYLFFRSGLLAGEEGKGGTLLDTDLVIGYEVRVKAISIEAFFPISAPADRNSAFLELFNDMNNNLVNARLHLNLETQIISLKGAMSLFGDPLNEKNFKSTLDTFVQTLNDFFPMIYDFLEGKATKKDILTRPAFLVKERAEKRTDIGSRGANSI
jgi:hypothetical protein